MEPKQAVSQITTFDGSLESWDQLEKTSHLFSSTDFVFLLESNEEILLRSIASLFVTSVMAHIDDKIRFPGSLFLFPPGVEAAALRTKACSETESLAISHGASLLTRIIIQGKFRTLVSLSIESLADEISKLPEDSLCCVIGVERFRSQDPSVTSPMDGPAFDPSKSHLTHLIRRLAILSDEKRLTIILFSESLPFDQFSEEGLRDINANFRAMTLQRPNDGPSLGMDELLKVYEKGGWEAVQAGSFIGQMSKIEDVAFQLAGFYANRKDFKAAWAVLNICPVPIEPENHSQALGMAVFAGENEEYELANKYFKELLKEDQLSLEELTTAHAYAQQYAFYELTDAFTDKLQRSFPNHTVTLHAEFRRSLRRRHFDRALAAAQKLKNPLLIAHAKTFGSPELDAEEYLNLTKSEGSYESGLLVCAEEALFRQRHETALHYCHRVESAHPLFFESFKIRARILSASLHKENEVFQNEFGNLLKIAADRPSQREYRDMILWLVEDGLEEPSAIVLLSAYILILLHRAQALIPISLKAASEVQARLDVRREQRPDAKTAEKAMEEMSELIAKELENGDLHLGHGEIPPHLREGIGIWNIHGICTELNAHKFEQNFQLAYPLLHLLVLICKADRHPTADFMALSGLVGARATIGDNQTCRDLAETALVEWSQWQQETAMWRTSLAWGIWADVALRSGSALQGLLYTTLALAANDGPALDSEWLGNLCRLAARSLRECHLTPAAFLPAEIERQLIEADGADAAQLHRNNILFATLNLPTVLAERGRDSMLGMLRELETLLEEGSTEHLFGLLGMQSSILRCLPKNDAPEDIVRSFTTRLGNVPESLRRRLSGTAFSEHSVENVRQAILDLPNAKYTDDLKFQIATALPFFCHAIDHACETGDPELFLVASGALAQPMLSAAVGQQDLQSFAPLADVTLAGLMQHIRPNEGVLLISGEPAGPPWFTYITSKGSTAPKKLGGWTSEERSRWRTKYYEVLEYELNGNVVLNPQLLPSEQAIKELMGAFDLPITELPETLIVIPPAYLFGFTFQLIPHGDSFLGLKCMLSVVPSPSWLIRMRAEPSQTSGDRQAWLGSAHTLDTPIHLLRSNVENCLTEYQFLIQRTDVPPNVSGDTLVFIGSHGSTGLRKYFRAVGDTIHEFTPSQVARSVSNCGCVTLAVCSGGRGDAQTNSSESLGLTSYMLSYGVRSVIAPAWPLDPTLMRHWLPKFLEELAACRPVKIAVRAAQNAVLNHVDRPILALHLQLHGDPDYHI